MLLGGLVTGMAAIASSSVLYAVHERTGWPQHFSNNEVLLNPLAGDQLSLITSYRPQITVNPEANNQHLGTLTDKDYLRQTFQRPRSAAPEADIALDAIRQSLRLVRGSSEHDTRGFATAWQIDEGGIYVTARHVVKQAFSKLANPYTNEYVNVAASFTHPQADIGLIVAPTGLPPSTSTTIRFAADSPQSGSTLRMVGLFPWNLDVSQQSKVYLYEKNGTAADIGPYQISVKELVPLGGTSGSPILDTSTGSVVGVESSLFYHYPDGPDAISNYAGAIITPISLLRDLPGK